jgi:hypothetical protein
MSEKINKDKTISNNDYYKHLMDRIYNLETNIITLQKGIDNIQFNFSVQSSQTQFIKSRNTRAAR